MKTHKKRLIQAFREKHYINATAQYYDRWQTVADKTRINNWAKAQEGVYKLYPDEIDAAAFYALSQLCTASRQDPEFSQQNEAGSLLNEFYKTSSTHPGIVHYTIHALECLFCKSPTKLSNK